MDALLQVKDLTKTYPGFTLDHVSFTVPKGSIMGLIGENGAGKSTTIKGILGLIRPEAGAVTFWGQDLAGAPELKEDIGVVFDGLSFYETLTPARVGSILGAAYRRWDDALYKEYMQRFSLPMDKEIKGLSKGMKAKLGIAAALAHRPRFLILDEATSGLDPVMRDDMLDVFLEFVQDEEHGILMSSHITTDLEKVADYITFIHEGRVLFTRPKDELRYQWGIVRCGAAAFGRMDPAGMLAWRKEAYQYDVLVPDKEAPVQGRGGGRCHHRRPPAVVCERGALQMKSLLLKDLYNISHNAKSMLVVLIFLAIAIVPTSGPIAYMVMCAVLCSMMIVTTFTFDDTCNWTPYALILPIGRRQIVLAKYAALAVFCTVGILFGLVASGVGAFLTSDGPFAAGGPVETLVGVLMGWSISFVMGSTAIPLVFRFGAEKARILIVAAFVIPAALVIAIAGVVTVALSGAAGVSGEALPDSVMIALFCASPLAALAWGAVMYRLSCGIFAKAEC